MLKVRLLVHRKSRGILPSRSEIRSRLRPWLAKQSIQVRTYSQLCRQQSIFLSPTHLKLKRAIEGRIQALANVHSLFVDTHWIGAELSAIATRELAPYSEKGKMQVRV